MDETKILSFPDVSNLSFSLKCNNSHTQIFILNDKVINTNIHPVAARQLFILLIAPERFCAELIIIWRKKEILRMHLSLIFFPEKKKWWWQFQRDRRFIELKNKQLYNYTQYYTIIQRTVWARLNFDPLGT